MRRSGGVTAAAVVLIVGSSFLVLMAGMTGLLPSVPQPAGEQNPFGVGFFYFEAVFILAVAGWGIATAVGILRLRNWARISILVMSVIAIVMSFFSILMAFILVPMISQNAKMPQGAILFLEIFEAITFGIPLGIAIWWMALFLRRSVAMQFQAAPLANLAQPLPAPGAPVLSGVGTLPVNASRVPVSILVIAIYFLATAPVSLVYFVSPFMQRMPMILFRQFLPPRAALVYMSAAVVVHLVLGLGLVFRRTWAHPLTLVYCVFLLGNCTVAILRPSLFYRLMERMQQVDPELARANGILPPRFFHLIASVGAICGLVLILAALYFLWTRREAYREACAAKP